jgi:hypothetical protein
MGWAEDQAARIRESQDQRRQAQDWQAQRLAILNQDSRSLWEQLIERIQVELDTFKSLVPAAKRLRVYPTDPSNEAGPNRLTIEAIEQPLIKIEFVYDDKRKTVRGTGYYQRGFGPMIDVRLGPVRIDVDPIIGVTFFENKPRGVQQITEAFMKPIGEFFSASPSVQITY